MHTHTHLRTIRQQNLSICSDEAEVLVADNILPYQDPQINQHFVSHFLSAARPQDNYWVCIGEENVHYPCFHRS